ncbi:MAG: copper amine oxidase N-terminal domain-containing protein [Firmicutes bacterium]|nr:copper amine oxidase N-terminal domain-containing protein [Bacillota bacterium]
MKKFAVLTAALLCAAVPVIAADSVNVTVNGTALEQKGVILESRTMVPVRGVTEELGYTVDWDADTKTATFTSAENVVKMTAGDSFFYVNDETVTPDVPQTIIEGRFMLPLRALCESVGAQVDWDGETKTAAITTETARQPKDEPAEEPAKEPEKEPEKGDNSQGNAEESRVYVVPEDVIVKSGTIKTVDEDTPVNIIEY